MNKKYYLTLDLKDDDQLIAEYEILHQKIWPEIQESIVAAGIVQMEIFRLGIRLVMVMEVNDSFSFEKKSAADAANPVVQEWEALMWKYQQALPNAKPGEKWMMMDKIFELHRS